MEHLMCRSRGHMQGILYYRQDTYSRWAPAYCAINASSGSLLGDLPNERLGYCTMIADLRECRVKASYDIESQSSILNVETRNSSDKYLLRPQHSSDFFAWFAALLCWQPVRSLQGLARTTRSEDAQLTPQSVPQERDRTRSKDDSPSSKDTSIIKVGKLMLWNGESIGEPASIESRDHGMAPSSSWTPVSCILCENGELKLYTTADVRTVAKVSLPKLSRSAVQRLCDSVLGTEFCIAIYPQYSRAADCSSRLRPLFLSCESRVLYEVWFVLLRAFTVPELYGPVRSPSADLLRSDEILPGLSQAATADLFRVERSLHVQVAEFRDKRPPTRSELADVNGFFVSTDNRQNTPDCYVQVLVDGQVKAKTRLKSGPGEVLWYENIDLVDLPATASFVSIQVRQLKAAPRLLQWEDLVTSKAAPASVHLGSNHHLGVDDEVVGELNLPFSELADMSNVDGRWNLLDEYGRLSGDISLKFRVEREVILMDEEYQYLSELLHSFSNALTIQISEKVSAELTKLASCLLNVFQVSGQAVDWLMALAEEEIDGVRKDQPYGGYQFNERVNTNESRDSLSSYGPANDREGLVRDFHRTTIAQAHLLFRGNTLLSKALDIHMQRLGKEYLEETIGPKMREIFELEPDLEVDPSRVSATACLPYNWVRLIQLTQEVWALIYESAPRCPPELRTVFRHIRACAEDRFGERMRSVPYSSVSGFLFLRFFCPAILNPKVFGLVNDTPKPRAQRSFTLIAKSLQGLANQTTLGAKEPWMEQMNAFLTSHKAEFRAFIDSICSVPSDAQLLSSTNSPSYSTPLAIFTRLTPAAREGFPSLPYLIDHSRNFAVLVDLWLDNYTPNPLAPEDALDDTLANFHSECLALRQRVRDVYARAERCSANTDTDTDGRSSLEEKWSEIATRMEVSPGEFWIEAPTPTPGANARPASSRVFGLGHSPASSSRPSTLSDHGGGGWGGAGAGAGAGGGGGGGGEAEGPPGAGSGDAPSVSAALSNRTSHSGRGIRERFMSRSRSRRTSEAGAQMPAFHSQLEEAEGSGAEGASEDEAEWAEGRPKSGAWRASEEKEKERAREKLGIFRRRKKGG